MTLSQNINKGISIVLGSYNRLSFLKLTIASIRKEMESNGIPFETIVIDGGSTDGSVSWLTEQKDIITIVQHNRGIWHGKQIERRSWGYFMNLGFKAAQGKYVCMLSDDCLIVPGSMKNGYTLFEQKLDVGEKVGAIAFYWRNWPDQKKYWIGFTFGGNIFVNHGLYLKSVLKEINYIDEESFLFYHGDSDLCLKIWHQGYRCMESFDSYIEHYSHANMSVRNSNLTNEQKDRKNLENKWTVIYDITQSGWIEKEYIDPNKTAYQFKQFLIFRKINTLKQICINLIKFLLFLK